MGQVSGANVPDCSFRESGAQYRRTLRGTVINYLPACRFFQRFKEDRQRRSITAHLCLFTASQALSFLIMHRVSQQNLIPSKVYR